MQVIDSFGHCPIQADYMATRVRRMTTRWQQVVNTEERDCHRNIHLLLWVSHPEGGVESSQPGVSLNSSKNGSFFNSTVL